MPIIDYGSQSWAPCDVGLFTKLEKLLKDFFSRIPEIKNQNYWDPLKTLKLYSLSTRFECYRILYTRKILKGDTPN